MSQTPEPDKKPKYNNNDPFVWVDSQWEKFMTEQKEHKAMIKKLQEDLATCTENFQIQRLLNLMVKNNREAQNEPTTDAFADLSCYGIIAQIVQNGKWGK